MNIKRPLDFEMEFEEEKRRCLGWKSNLHRNTTLEAFEMITNLEIFLSGKMPSSSFGIVAVSLT